MYRALYRKYRPGKFSDVTGQEHITETLRRQIETDRLSHAYLFVGTRGTGKTTCAKILSRAVNCEKPEDGNPCNKCTACVGIENGSILDVLELDAASNNSVDNVRALRDEAIYSPAAVRKRVYIVDEVHMLSTAAFNALLKILEEPPEHILFILATTELHKVPETIQSRCQKYSFRRLSSESIISRLSSIASSEGLKPDDEALEKLASLADGSMRDAVSLLDQCASDKPIDLHYVEDTLGLAGQQKLVQMAEVVIDRDIGTALKILDELYSGGKDMAALLSELTALMRDILIYKLTPETVLLSSGIASSDLAKLSKNFSSEKLLLSLEIMKDALFGLSRAGNPKLAVEMCLIKIIMGATAPDGQLSTKPEPPQRKTPPAETEAPKRKTPSVEPEKTPPAPEPSPQKTGTDITEIILKEITEPSVRALLSDSTKVSIKEDNGKLIVTASEPFTASMIEAEYIDTLKEAANKALGKTLHVNIETGPIEIKSNGRSKLESLSAFGVVDFE
ncbi:MAG: DNA polymerase III subunit gamma/tau [Oscillospiraceae bacterium]|nr:DNA polymerase III subunit gamma/tau [Oscillospiraceae bacterium]MCL2278229.1 DNA polymerase III subunit gamma/tau [Oscillospiraceae bacterium]